MYAFWETDWQGLVVKHSEEHNLFPPFVSVYSEGEIEW